MANVFAIAGLVYDIVGAIAIAAAIAGTRTELLRQQVSLHGQFQTGNLALYAALEDQRNDARFGLAFLVIGFLLQLVAALGYGGGAGGWTVTMLVAALVAGLCAWRLCACYLTATRLVRFVDSLETTLQKVNFCRNNEEEPPSSACVRIVRLFRFNWLDRKPNV